MITICSGFFDTCIPLGLFKRAQTDHSIKPQATGRSQHNEYWEQRCSAFPDAPGCKIYAD